jgi:hypothetical protein
MAIFAEACAYAYKLSGDKEFQRFVVGFRAYFSHYVINGEDGAYSWPYAALTDKSKRMTTLLWKAAITAQAFVRIQDAHIDVDLERDQQVGIVRALTNYILQPHYVVNAYVRKTPVFPLTGYTSYYGNYADVNMLPLYMSLDEWVPEVRNIILKTIALRPDLFPEGLLFNYTSAVAYSHLLLYPRPIGRD